METKDYEKQANDFLEKHKIGFKAIFKGDKCPLWCDGSCMHGERYLITFKRDVLCNIPGGKRFSLSFWNSINDVQEGKRPTTYDVLACIEKNEPGDLEEFCGNFGYDIDNKKTLKTYNLVVKEWEKISNFFTSEELEELQEIN